MASATPGRNPTLEYLKHFPPGYRFRPLDEELILCYLKKKVKNQPLPPNRIVDVDVYQHNPEYLAETYEDWGEEEEWYFFTPRDRKYKNGTRPKRAAGDGYWKATGADKQVEREGHVLGFRKALVFYRGKPPKGDKTNWIMHEYRTNEPPRNKTNADDMRLDDWVLCRIYKKADHSPKTPPLNYDPEYESELQYINISNSEHKEEDFDPTGGAAGDPDTGAVGAAIGASANFGNGAGAGIATINTSGIGASARGDTGATVGTSTTGVTSPTFDTGLAYATSGIGGGGGGGLFASFGTDDYAFGLRATYDVGGPSNSGKSGLFNGGYYGTNHVWEQFPNITVLQYNNVGAAFAFPKEPVDLWPPKTFSPNPVDIIPNLEYPSYPPRNSARDYENSVEKENRSSVQLKRSRD